MADRTEVYNIKKISKNTKMKRSGNLKFIVRAFFMIVFFVLLFFIICGMFFFKVKSIKINGNIYYDPEEIIQQSGIERGTAIFTVNKSDAANKIKENFPYIKSVKIKIIFPNSVKIDLENDTGVYKIKLGGEYYIISEHFKVLCKEDAVKKNNQNAGENTDGYETNIINIKTDSAVKCFVGKSIMFSDIDIKDILTLFFKAFNDSEIFDDINELDITDKFNIYLIYGGRFRIEYGNFEDVGIKTQLAYKIIQRLYDDDMGIIDVRDKKEGGFMQKRNIY